MKIDKHRTRNIIQLAFLGIWLILLLIIVPVFLGTCHQFCPFAVVCFGPMALQGYSAFLPMIIIGFIILVSVLFIGRKFCGYICFLGTLQEYIHKLNKRKNKRRVPPNLHKFLCFLKYVFFLAVLVMAVLMVQYRYMQSCPLIVISFISVVSVAGIITLVVILGSFFVERLWCRYLCPYAAIMNIFQYLGRLLKIKRAKIKRNMEVCIDCYLCTKNCPMNIDLTQFEVIEDVNCIQCMKCIKVCPKDKCLSC